VPVACEFYAMGRQSGPGLPVWSRMGRARALPSRGRVLGLLRLPSVPSCRTAVASCRAVASPPAFLGHRIQAQAYLERFYGSHGFESAGGVYLEDGIPHIDMTLTPGRGLPEA
jgi:hypothetical protein